MNARTLTTCDSPPRFSFEGPSNLCSDVISNDNKWHHIVAVRDGNNIQLYIDGKLNVSGTGWAGWNASSTSPLYISHPVASHSFNGLLDDARVYEQALTEAQIKQLYVEGAEIHKNNLASESPKEN